MNEVNDYISYVNKNEQDMSEKYEKSFGYFLVKRLIDLIGSICGLVLLSPLLTVIAIIIKCDSKGPIFFVQERVGFAGEVFKMYKFRSMCMDAECKLDGLKESNEMSGPMFKMTDDPRITKIGKFIRKTSIDELPQLLNVLKGEMSLVGPRPNLPREVVQFENWMKDKFLCKPGLTCYWQVMGRNDIDFEEWMELDIKYLKERSVFVDIKLIFQTVGVLFGDEKAK
ncbi:sugar transferase [Clostridium sediminicola]|uniref:sugar transferase n=1 Tax=Clostridium sediminicola TaxID=3114879 RepID=UPI0031F1F562